MMAKIVTLEYCKSKLLKNRVQRMPSSPLRQEARLFSVYNVFDCCLPTVHLWCFKKITFHKLVLNKHLQKQQKSEGWSKYFLSLNESCNRLQFFGMKPVTTEKFDVTEHNFRKWVLMIWAVKLSLSFRNTLWNQCRLSFRSCRHPYNLLLAVSCLYKILHLLTDF